MPALTANAWKPSWLRCSDACKIWRPGWLRTAGPPVNHGAKTTPGHPRVSARRPAGLLALSVVMPARRSRWRSIQMRSCRSRSTGAAPVGRTGRPWQSRDRWRGRSMNSWPERTPSRGLAARSTASSSGCSELRAAHPVWPPPAGLRCAGGYERVATVQRPLGPRRLERLFQAARESCVVWSSSAARTAWPGRESRSGVGGRASKSAATGVPPDNTVN